MSGGLAWSAVVTACGTRVAIQGDRACQHIWVFDIAPYLDASRGRGDGQEDAKFMAIGNHSCNAEDEKDVPPWSERVRSGYPCRMHLVSVPPSMAAATPAGILMDDVMQVSILLFCLNGPYGGVLIADSSTLSRGCTAGELSVWLCEYGL